MAEPPTTRRPSRGRRRRRGRGKGIAPENNQLVPLHKRSASHFHPGDRQRGNEYFDDERVTYEIEDARARARVVGSTEHPYCVGLDWSRVSDERVLHAFCECPRFAEGTPCKHLWATLLALEEAGPEHQPEGKDRLGLRRDPAASWPDLELSAENAARAEQAVADAANGARPPRRKRGRASHKRQVLGRDLRHTAGANSWQALFASVREEADKISSNGAAAPTRTRNERPAIRLLVNTSASTRDDGLVLDLFGMRPDGPKKGPKLKPTSAAVEEIEQLLRGNGGPDGRATPALIAAFESQPPNRRRGGTSTSAMARRLRLPPALYAPVLRRLCEERALGWWNGQAVNGQQSLVWDDGPPFEFALKVDVMPAGTARLRGMLERGAESIPISEPLLILPAGGGSSGVGTEAGSLHAQLVVLFADSVALLESSDARELSWIDVLRERGDIVIPHKDLEDAMAHLLELPTPRLELPEELQITTEEAIPKPRLVLDNGPTPAWMNPPLLASLSFEYDGLRVDAGDPRPAVADLDGRRFLRRDMAREHAALVRLLELGMRPVPSSQGHGLELSPTDLAAVAEPLLQDGWTVEVHGTSVRPPNPPSLRVESGIDWFELKGEIEFDGDPIELATILDAVKRGDRFVKLGDGSKGLLPSAWMETYGSLSQLSHGDGDDSLRFLHSQALLVDALLIAMPPVDVDGTFAKLRTKLRSFERIKAKKEPRGFSGTLRGYQREGLGWLSFLREFGLGGVLADDMGLGKTVQALALLRANRTPTKTTELPFLVVAPRSLLYNWIDEAGRFTPGLKVAEYSGSDRDSMREQLGKLDLVVTTYGTLRRDIGFLATQEFDTVILDEAQAIKNPSSQTAKACRLLNAQHRLALTGTPIENHLGELGSLFEFLNPGLLGRLPGFDALGGGLAPSERQLKLIAEGIRPFILRRTKAQVLPDLPPKTEQVLLCTLRPRQRELYDQLRASYQANLLRQVEETGVPGSAIQVLEALLRLRQVACHPGLVDPAWEEAGSAKLDSLLEQVTEVLDEGHKVIVFSQFTSLLAFVKARFDERSVPYAYLDGQTRNRGEVVERFQTDPTCNLFLISLKAGGLGLNLTAAGYVYLLDPWWNPAVEAQAIDRAHRIGQTQPVFAYRLIARDTVEEKIVELQKSKRQLADAVLEGDGQSLRDLTADDLRVLLS